MRSAESIADGGSARGSVSATSWVRVFFNLTADDHAVCLLAPDATYFGMTAHNNQISRTGGTPNLVRHLKGVFHEKSMKKYNELVAAGKAPEHAAADTIARARAAEEASAVTHFMKKAKKYNAPDEAVMRELALVCFAIDKGLSFNSLESTFLTLHAELGQQAPPPSRRRISRTLLPLLYSLVADKQTKLLASVDYFSITTDGWTASNNEQYIALTVHFVDRLKWTLEVRVGMCKQLSYASKYTHIHTHACTCTRTCAHAQ